MKQIDKVIYNTIMEEIDKKSRTSSIKFGEWVEINSGELKGNQKKLDVAEPKGKLTSADFKKLRSRKSRRNLNTEEESEIEETNKKLKGNQKKLDVAEPKGKLTSADFKKLRSRKDKKTVKLTENELINLIERVVLQEKKKSNISEKEPVGLKKTNKVRNLSRKENQQYAGEVSTKMNNYLKNMGGVKYNGSPNTFPKSNRDLNNKNTKAYKPSEAVEEYIENFAYPVFPDYDEIKPNENWVSDNIQGSSRTGNNPKWANAEETDFGKKFNKIRKNDLYNKEKKRSYKRATQPIDTAGEDKGEKSINKMFAKLESVSDNNRLITEEISLMKNMINYNSKTQ